MQRKRGAMIGIGAAIVLGVLGMAQESRPAVCPECSGVKYVNCRACGGDWRQAKTTAKCENKGGQGCDGTGVRECFSCSGRGWVTCDRCAGDGRTGNPLRKCGACKGKGKVECPACKKAEFGSRCVKCHRYLGPGLDGPCVCGSSARWPGRELPKGQVICPRCKGTGRYEVVGKCPECNKGKVICPSCGGTGKPRPAASQPAPKPARGSAGDMARDGEQRRG